MRTVFIFSTFYVFFDDKSISFRNFINILSRSFVCKANI